MWKHMKKSVGMPVCWRTCDWSGEEVGCKHVWFDVGRVAMVHKKGLGVMAGVMFWRGHRW